jgi:alkylation response protein AidB-like acyl-CoA dehydrogenase
VRVGYHYDAEAFRTHVRAFLRDHLPPAWSGVGALGADEQARFVEEWRAVLHEHGLLAPSWPREYGGGGLTALEQVIVAEEFAHAGVPTGGPNDTFGINMLGNTLVAVGSDEQKRYFLPRILSGADRWCQGYSEPDAGSDLASLRCRARLDGDAWVIEGQKVWTSAGHLANWIFVLARTDPAAPAHKGITFLLCPLDQPGIEVRPIKMMTGHSEFNEVIFDGARTAADHVVGEPNGGWPIAMTLLGFERGAAAATLPIRFRGELDRLLALARERGVAEDPVIRDRLAAAYSRVEVLRFLGYRSLTSFLAGASPGAESSVFKLFWSEHHRRLTELAMDILGASGLVPEGRMPAGPRMDHPGAPNTTGSWVGTFLVARGGTIYAGTSEIQRNILGERVLGLRRD